MSYPRVSTIIIWLIIALVAWIFISLARCGREEEETEKRIEDEKSE